MLKFVANTINFVIKGFGTAGRYGGDEFVACVRNIETNEPTRVARDILSGLKEGFTSDNGDKLSVNASIGISIIKDSSMHVDEIIGMADDAMYKSRRTVSRTSVFSTRKWLKDPFLTRLRRKMLSAEAITTISVMPLLLIQLMILQNSSSN